MGKTPAARVTCRLIGGVRVLDYHRSRPPPPLEAYAPLLSCAFRAVALKDSAFVAEDHLGTCLILYPHSSTTAWSHITACRQPSGTPKKDLICFYVAGVEALVKKSRRYTLLLCRFLAQL